MRSCVSISALSDRIAQREAVIDYDAIIEGVAPSSEVGALEALSVRLLQLEKQIAALLRELRKQPASEE